MPRFFLHLTALALLAGCAAYRPEPELIADRWRFTGKLTLQTSEESRILGIEWRQAGEVSEIDLKGPLGVRVATVTAHDGELVIDTGRRVVRYRDDAVLLGEGFDGLKLPWKSLSYWVRGQAGPGGQKFVGPDIQRGSWHFNISEIGTDGPLAMTLEHPLVELRLRVKKWVIEGYENI